ncbi:MAG: single-stranded DNA-binding protein [Christensenellales bacterium]|jgi:single-stranded DNA-binding protein
MENPNNRIVAVGRLEGALSLSHEVMNEPFFTGTLLVKRLSGTLDKLPLTIPGKLMAGTRLDDGRLMMVQGQVRSYNKVIDGAGRLMVTLFAQGIHETAENDTLNKVSLSGALCRPPVYRSTPFGREICDMMLAVNRAFGKSDYVPCIAWGRNAQYASRFRIGDKVRLTGRLQSREYQKLLENGEYMVRMAYEVSAFTLEPENLDDADAGRYADYAAYAADGAGSEPTDADDVQQTPQPQLAPQQTSELT